MAFKNHAPVNFIVCEPESIEHIRFLGVFESDAITNPVELAKFQREMASDRLAMKLTHQVDEFFESEGEAITDPAVLARLRPQVDPARKVR